MFSLLRRSFLSSSSLLQSQVDDCAIVHVVVSQRVGILDENALIKKEIFWSGTLQGYKGKIQIQAFTSYCNFCFPAGMPVASWILTLMTDTCGYIGTAHQKGCSSTVNSTPSATVAHLISKRNGEIQHLAAQLPFALVLHVGNLHLNCHRTLGEGGKTQEQRCNKSVWTQTQTQIPPAIQANLVPAKELLLGNQVVLRLHLLAEGLVIARRGWVDGWRGDNTWGLWYRRSRNKCYRQKGRIFELGDDQSSLGSDIKTDMLLNKKIVFQKKCSPIETLLLAC